MAPFFFFFGEMIRYITSDCGAVGIIHDQQGYAKSAEDAVADVLRAGMLYMFGPKYRYLLLLYVILIIVIILLNLLL